MSERRRSGRFTVIPVEEFFPQYADYKRRFSLSKYDERLAKIEADFRAKEAELKKLTEQRKQIDQRVGVLNSEMLILQGKYNALDELKKEEGEVPPVSVQPDGQDGKVN